MNPASPTEITHASEASNPWLRQSETNATRTKNDIVVAKESKASDKSAYSLKKHLKPTTEDVDDAQMEISTEDHLRLADPPKGKQGKGRSNEDSSSESDSEGEFGLAEQRKPKLKQRDLVAMAFAGDNVIQVGHCCPVFSELIWFGRLIARAFYRL